MSRLSSLESFFAWGIISMMVFEAPSLESIIPCRRQTFLIIDPLPCSSLEYYIPSGLGNMFTLISFVFGFSFRIAQVKHIILVYDSLFLGIV